MRYGIEFWFRWVFCAWDHERRGSLQYLRHADASPSPDGTSLSSPPTWAPEHGLLSPEAESPTAPVYLEARDFFAQQAEDALGNQGYPYTTLNTSVWYRGDTRSPGVVFREGFVRRFEVAPEISAEGESYGLIAVTQDLAIAVGFAVDPMPCQGDSPSHEPPEEAWVYCLSAASGFDVRQQADAYKARLGNEVALTDVTADHVLSAMQIRLPEARRDALDFCPPRPWCEPSQAPTPRVRVTRFAQNPHALLQSDACRAAVASMRDCFERGWFDNPYA